MYKGISSIRLLEHVGRLLEEERYLVENIDATIIAQRPKMLPHIESMRKNIAETLGISVDQVNIKATTEERFRRSKPLIRSWGFPSPSTAMMSSFT